MSGPESAGGWCVPPRVGVHPWPAVRGRVTRRSSQNIKLFVDQAEFQGDRKGKGRGGGKCAGGKVGRKGKGGSNTTYTKNVVCKEIL